MRVQGHGIFSMDMTSLPKMVFALGVLAISGPAVSCSELQGLVNEPKSGIYLRSNGAQYKINTNGPAAITLKNNNGLCLLFWKKKGGADTSGTVNLIGEACGTKKPKLRWKATFNHNKSDRFIIIPPKKERFEIVYSSKSQ